jgi:hypothetical protein
LPDLAEQFPLRNFRRRNLIGAQIITAQSPYLAKKVPLMRLG